MSTGPKYPLLLALLLAACDRSPGEGASGLSGVAPPAGWPIPGAPAPAPSPPPAPPEPPAPPPPDDFGTRVESRWFTLRPGRLMVYEGFDEGRHRRDEIRDLDGSRLIEGVTCVGTLQTVFLDGVAVELTVEWYAQDAAGNVWKFGEETAEFGAGLAGFTDDSWIAGEEGARAWIAFPAEPRVGDRIHGYKPAGHDVFVVTAVDAVASVPAGEFPGCLELDENPDDEDEDILVYAPGTGLVSERSASGHVGLVEVRER